ncbi:NAD(P)/FAD-dependent oxidoreductase [Microvirga calopogonii]|uniref:NAD(P)/FAD-dependent oxidoreductase n=1 Tax=Microvirga calopogonii TaxID=2078013 RepID=UPI0013B42E77|nr:FAD-binding oxidoreductase [Microvirga calopogonii]
MPYHPLSDPGDLPQTVYGLTAPAAPRTEPLRGARAVDVAVIGAGFTGLSAALHAAEAGARVMVLEANEIGWGASGRNFGQVVPYLRHEASHALRYFGPVYGERLVTAAASGPDLVFSLIDRLGIECQANRKGLIIAGHTPAAVRALARRSEFWDRRGVSLPLLNPSQTAELIGGGNYPGALLESRGGTINPLAYARGLAAAAVANGAIIHTRSRVTRISREPGDWRLATTEGNVMAGTVLIGTNAYTDSLWPGLQRSIVPMRTYQLVSHPLSENLRRSILPGEQALTDTRRMASGVRRHPDGRLQVTADGPRFSALETPAVAAAVRRLETLFPQLGRVEWEFAWSGWLALTPEEYPRLHELASGVFAALGYSGRGIALGTVLGRELARRAMGASPDSLVLPFTAPRTLGFPTLNEVAVKTVIGYKRLLDAIDLQRMKHRVGPEK